MIQDQKVHQLPWLRLNSLLGGFPGFSLDAASKGGVADGEVMAICGGPRSFRTTIAVWLAAHFIEQHKKNVTFFTYIETFVREAVAGARLGYPISGPARPGHLTWWNDNGHDLDVFDPGLGDAAPEDRFTRARSATGAIIIDVDSTIAGSQQAAEFVLGARHVARLYNVPVFCTFRLGASMAKSSRPPLERIPERISTVVDHVLLLNPTDDRRYLLMELTNSRTGKDGLLLLDGATLKEAL